MCSIGKHFSLFLFDIMLRRMKKLFVKLTIPLHSVSYVFMHQFYAVWETKTCCSQRWHVLFRRLSLHHKNTSFLFFLFFLPSLSIFYQSVFCFCRSSRQHQSLKLFFMLARINNIVRRFDWHQNMTSIEVLLALMPTEKSINCE